MERVPLTFQLSNIPSDWFLFNSKREIINSSFLDIKTGLCFKTLLKQGSPCTNCPLETNQPDIHQLFWDNRRFIMYCLPSYYQSQNGVFALLTEVTELNHYKHLINTLEIAFLHLPIYLRLVDPKRQKILYENSKLQSDFGKHVGEDCFSFWSQGPCKNCVGMKAILQKNPVTKQERVNNRLWQIKAVPIMKEDGQFEVLEIIQDITFYEGLNQKIQQQNSLLLEKLEEQAKELAERKKMAALGEMAASLAHELKNPLGAITTALKLLQNPNRNIQEQNFILKTITKEVERLNQVLNHFLTYARFKPPNKQEVDLCQIIAEVYEMIKKAPEFKQNIQFKFDISPDLPKVLIDPEQWKQVFWNLYLNALEFTSEGEIRTKVWTDKKYLFIEISDTGQGIETQDLPQIFKPFFSKRPQGTGLGLAVIKKIVNIHQGQINVLSQPHKGTVFNIKIPVKS